MMHRKTPNPCWINLHTENITCLGSIRRALSATRHRDHAKINACFKANSEEAFALVIVGWKNRLVLKCWPAAVNWQGFFANTFMFHDLARKALDPKTMIGTT